MENDLLNEAREIINEVDREMALLFRRRMEAVKMVAEYKIERGLPVLDAKREEAVIARNSEFLAELPHIPDDEHGALSEYEPYAIVLPSGKIIVHIRGERYGEHRVFGTWQSVSTDGGKTFSVPEMIGGSNCAGAPAHILRHSSGKLISAVGNRKAPYGINILTSDDDGETWEKILDVDPIAGYADIAVYGNSIYIFYEHGPWSRRVIERLVVKKYTF
jgi:chorismate mutase